MISESAHEPDEKLKAVKFDCTPSMPTYLVAFAVGEFDYVEGHSTDGILCRVYTPVGKSQQGGFSLDFTTKALPYFKEYFGIKYPLPKMDLIAVASHSSGLLIIVSIFPVV